MNYIIGIDPGLTGAIAILNRSTLEIEQFCDMPTVPKPTKGRKVSPIGVLNFLNEFSQERQSTIDWLCVEQVSARPHDGPVQAFAFGRSVGAIDGIAAALGYPQCALTPQTWKKLIGIPRGSEKEYSRTVAIDLFPDASKDLARKKDVGRAEAALIALAANRHQMRLGA